jgi:hypothetical protein
MAKISGLFEILSSLHNYTFENLFELCINDFNKLIISSESNYNFNVNNKSILHSFSLCNYYIINLNKQIISK